VSPKRPSRPHRGGYSRNIALAVLTANVGCLTVLITIAAMFLGLWLDGRFSSKPWFTLGIMLLSLPVSLYVMFFVVRWTTSKMSLEDAQKKTIRQKGNDLD
jgi:F0F1-type ATP synthase assembly protein I